MRYRGELVELRTGKIGEDRKSCDPTRVHNR
jgi:hypothetical protein